MYLKFLLGILIAWFAVANGKAQFSDNTPPTLTVDRQWEIPDTEPVGSIITRVRAHPEKESLVFGLESRDPNLSNPFAIDSRTGVVTLRDSLEKRAGEQFLISVTADDGQFAVRNEVYVKIKSSKSGPGGVIVPIRPLVPTSNRSPFPHIPLLNKSPTYKTEAEPPPSPTKKERTTTESIPSTTVNATANSTSLTPATAELTYTIVPIVIICGILFVATVIAFLFRRRICKYRNKIQKEEMRKESHGAIMMEDPIAMQHWRGPMAFNNRYEGWDSNRAPQPPPIQCDREIMKRGDNWEFPRHHLKVFNILGEGCFGQVWRCEALNIDVDYGRMQTGGRMQIYAEGGESYNCNDGTTIVAVKTLKGNAGEKERNDLIQELEVMKMLEPHPNVVRLLGCCTEKDPLFVIMEYIALGKLQSYLRNSRAERCYGTMHAESKTLTSRDLTSFAYQCARGMEFLSGKGIIHRDLAARNILVSADHTCKVADFGFARDVIDSHVYERKTEGRLPIRWMAPESLYDNIFSVKSDVWSFGVLVWEIVTLGSTPYPGLAAADVMRKVRDGYRLEKPDHCRRELYNIMYYCWDKDPKERPSFEELVSMLEQLLLSETDYIELERFPDHSYYNMVSLSGEKL